MARRKIAGSRILLTGASSGIGYALAIELARRGARLLATARREDRLEQLRGELRGYDNSLVTIAGDITDTSHQHELLDAATGQLGGLDILVNNAGITTLGPFEQATDEQISRVMQVNFAAPVALTQAALPMLRDGTRPMIVNVASVLAHRAVPNKAIYCASKFAMHGFSDALRAELAREGIDVLLVSPSTTATEIFEVALSNSQAEADPPPGTAGRGMKPSRVAAITARAIERGKQEVILSLGGKLLVWADRLCPPLMNRIIAKFG